MPDKYAGLTDRQAELANSAGENAVLVGNNRRGVDMARNVKTRRYTSTHGLYIEARALIESYAPEDIADEDGNRIVIVDTILSCYGHNAADVAEAIGSLGGSVKDCCDECQAAGELRTGDEDGDPCEWLEETLEDVASQEATRINGHLPAKAVGSFDFEWFDGGYVLEYIVSEGEEEEHK